MPALRPLSSFRRQRHRPPIVNPDGTTAPTEVTGNVLENDSGPLTVVHVQDADENS